MTYLEEISSIKNITRSWNLIKKKRNVVPGVDGIDVDEFSKNQNEFIKKISSDLKSDKYVFQKVKRISIPKKSGKPRPIGIYIIRDKIVQKSLQSLFERKNKNGFCLFPDIYNTVSIGFVNGKYKGEAVGVKSAITKIRAQYKLGYKYITTADIKDFFNVIDKSNLKKRIIDKLTPDKSLNRIIDDCLNPEVIEMDRYSQKETALPSTNEGVAQGSVLSPLFSNIFMSEFDKSVEKLNIPAIRYADDFAFFSKSKFCAKKDLRRIKKLLKDTTSLEFHPDGSDKAPYRYKISSWGKFLGIKFKKIDHSNRWEIHPILDNLDTELKIIKNCLFADDNLSLLEKINSINRNISGWLSTYLYVGCTKKSLKEMYKKIKLVYELEINNILQKRGITVRQLSSSELVFLGVLKPNFKNKKKK